MYFVNACLLVSVALRAPDTKSDFTTLTQQMAPVIQWIDQNGSIETTQKDAKNRLNQLINSLHNPDFSTRHQSNWKNNQCYQIINVHGAQRGYRIFFRCERGKHNTRVVTKIKVNQM